MGAKVGDASFHQHPGKRSEHFRSTHYLLDAMEEIGTLGDAGVGYRKPRDVGNGIYLLHREILLHHQHGDLALGS